MSEPTPSADAAASRSATVGLFAIAKGAVAAIFIIADGRNQPDTRETSRDMLRYRRFSRSLGCTTSEVGADILVTAKARSSSMTSIYSK